MEKVRGGCNFRKQKSQYPELRVQLEVFDDQRETDEELANQGPPGIDLSSHVDVFYAILGQASIFFFFLRQSIQCDTDIKFFIDPDCRYAARNSFLKYPTASAAAGSKGAGKWSRLGHRWDVGAPSDSSWEPQWRD